MFKIEEKIRLKEGELIILCEVWHKKILDFLSTDDFPRSFIFQEKIKTHELKEPLYLFASDQKKVKKQKRILLSSNVVRCLFGTEVPDSNVGCSFREYLPSNDVNVIITSIRNPENVHGAFFNLKVNYFRLEDEKVLYLDFILENLIGISFNDVSYYTKGNKSNWKFLDTDDTTYMSRYEMTIQDALIHKRYVIDECTRLSEYLESVGAVKHSKMILERGKVHDNSKITCEDEFNALSQIIHLGGKMSSLQPLSPYEAEFTKLHQKHNSHHVEYHNSVYDIPRIDIMEFACDICARSKQKGTSPIDYMIKAQEERFHFPAFMYDEVMFYIDILLK